MLLKARLHLQWFWGLRRDKALRLEVDRSPLWGWLGYQRRALGWEYSQYYCWNECVNCSIAAIFTFIISNAVLLYSSRWSLESVCLELFVHERRTECALTWYTRSSLEFLVCGRLSMKFVHIIIIVIIIIIIIIIIAIIVMKNQCFYSLFV